MLREKAPRSTKEAALWIVQKRTIPVSGQEGDTAAEDTIRKNLPTIVGDTGLEWRRLGCTMRIIVRVTGKGNVAAYDLDFEQLVLSGNRSGN